MRWRILISCLHAQRRVDRFRNFLDEHNMDVDLPDIVQQLSEADLLKIIDRYDGVVAGDDEFTERVLEQAKRLKVISKWGIGIDAIDVAAARRRGIRVFNTPDAFGDEVGDVVMGYLILLARQLHRIDAAIRSGGWLKIEGTSLQGKTLGIIGLGNIGQSVARRAVASGMLVIGYDVQPDGKFLNENPAIQFVALNQIWERSDFISLNCNLTPGNRHLINDDTIRQMKAGVNIVNTARGALIDEAALVRALDRGLVAGAALDVFESEPLPLEHPLRRYDCCILGSHNSSNTVEAVDRVTRRAFENLLEGLKQ